MVTQRKQSTAKTEVVFVFQGGGALGAYQVGVFEALTEGGYAPDWIAGTSIGAINAAIIAGNKPNERLDKLKQFWDGIASNTALPFDNLPFRRIHNFWSAQLALMFGQPDFFLPRMQNPWFGLTNSPATISFYDTSPLKSTLERLIDFDLINSKKVRLSLGAVEVRTGKRVYFENKNQKIGPLHVMASGALPPGFPAVEIEGKMYWDGGISSNTPVAHVIRSNSGVRDTLCFMVQLFDSYGLLPTTLDEVLKRKKDIIFSSQYQREILTQRELHRLRTAVRQMSTHLPEDKKNDPEIQKILKHSTITTMQLVRFHYRGRDFDLSSKDYEFSGHSLTEHLQSGYRDGRMGILKSPWLKPLPKSTAIAVHEIAKIHITEDEA